MASRPRDEGQLLLLAGVLLVISYVMFSTQASLVATLGQQAGREVTNPVINDYQALRETLALTLVREHTDTVDPHVSSDDVLLCPASQEGHYRSRAEAILANFVVIEQRRGLALHAVVEDVQRKDVGGDLSYEYTIALTLTNGETTIQETAIFEVDKAAAGC